LYRSIINTLKETAKRIFARIDIIEDQRSEDPIIEAQKRDLKHLLTKGLSRAERLIIILYYYEEMTMKEIGATLDLSESRVSQMHFVDRRTPQGADEYPQTRICRNGIKVKVFGKLKGRPKTCPLFLIPSIFHFLSAYLLGIHQNAVGYDGRFVITVFGVSFPYPIAECPFSFIARR